MVSYNHIIRKNLRLQRAANSQRLQWYQSQRFKTWEKLVYQEGLQDYKKFDSTLIRKIKRHQGYDGQGIRVERLCWGLHTQQTKGRKDNVVEELCGNCWNAAQRKVKDKRFELERIGRFHTVTRKRSEASEKDLSVATIQMASTSEKLCHRYSLAEIQFATQNFDSRLVIGQGGFGTVYKGCIRNGEGRSLVVAIKRLDSVSVQGAPEFQAEIKMLSKLRHSHLVSLLGFCDDNKEMILVYEYMPHETVYYHLHKSKTTLSWMQRLKISIGAARGLDYLHTGAGIKHGVIHRDVKSSNILLDENWAAKISDFGLAKICPTNEPRTYVNTQIKGSFGYLDPELFLDGKLTRKTDVFAFGVVLFELLSGRHAVLPDGDEDLSLARWAQKCVKKRKLNEIAEVAIRGKLCPKSLKIFSQIAYRCLHSDPKERPTMSEVVAALQLSESIQERFEKSSQTAGLFGFTRKMQKYIFLPSEIQGMKIFSYSELKCATRNFHNPIMRSGRGWVTKGWVDKKTYSPSKLDVGLAIFVIQLRSSTQWDLHLLSQFRHPNLVKLLGYCLQDKTLYLVHEFMDKRNLGLPALKIFEFAGAAIELSFPRRVKIAVGVARGLAFLQIKQLLTRKWVLQMRDIWLDKDFNAKLSDFDVAKLIHRFNTMDRLTYESTAAGSWWQQLRLCDVNGLGMLLMELLTGKPIPSKRKMGILEEKYLCDKVAKMSDKMIEDAVDRRLVLSAPEIESARELLSLILKCTRYHYTMEEALKKLEQINSRVTEM
ncbi:kinase RLK-Pelle-CrRLK1L-1 family protein [Tanacetum coccineum]